MSKTEDEKGVATKGIEEMDENDEAECEREQGLEQGYEYAAEQWETEWEEDKDAARESIACLVYRQPSQLVYQHIQDPGASSIYFGEYGLGASKIGGAGKTKDG